MHKQLLLEEENEKLTAITFGGTLWGWGDVLESGACDFDVAGSTDEALIDKDVEVR